MIKDKFFDRKNYLDILEKRIIGLKDNYRQNIAVIGVESVGKTSIIFKLLEKFYDNRIVILYLEARPETLDSFARRFIGILLYNFLANSGIPLKEDTGFLINKAATFIPRTTEKIELILNALNRKKKNDIFTELFSLCEIIHQETGKPCVVILDEFQNLESLGIKDLYRQWSKLLIAQKNTMYVIISSMKFKTKLILSKNLSLLFGNFEVVTVEPFDIKTSEQYLTNKLQGQNLDSGLKNFLVHFTGGCPFYLELITDALLESKEPSLADILENLIFDSSGVLNQKFSNYIRQFLSPQAGGDCIPILYLISSGRNKVKDIAHILKMQKKELDSRINRILEIDAITRCLDFLKINDRVFGFWLRFVYQEKLQSLTFDAKNQKKKFRENIEDLIQDFFVNSRKSIVERVTEVLKLFEDESMQIDRKKVRLKSFREIKPVEFNNKSLKEGLLGRSSDSLWIVAFKDNILTEDDIAEFADECRRYRHRPQKKIIVTLQDIDMNTRLRALEEKVWAWDINSLNQILDLYSKPWVVV